MPCALYAYIDSNFETRMTSDSGYGTADTLKQVWNNERYTERWPWMAAAREGATDFYIQNTGYEQSQKSAEKFIALIDKYENFDTLTNTMLNEFVEKILVHERARKGSQDTTQEIEIYFNFLGRYIPPSLQPVPLTPEEQEELRKKEERKDRLHQNYLKRKASGAQKRYEDKIKAKKKAEMDAKKALIRAEDMKKGVFSTIGQLPKEEPRKGSIAASAAV